MTKTFSVRMTAVLVSALLLVGMLSFSLPARAAGLNEVQIQAILSLLASFGADASVINNVSLSLHGQSTTALPAAGYTCVVISNNLSQGMTSGEVEKLQSFLAQDTAIYPEGKVTGYFGPATARAVMRWQTAHGLYAYGESKGAVGPQTRAALAQDGGCVQPVAKILKTTVYSTAPTVYFSYSGFPSSGFGADLMGASDGKVYQNGIDQVTTTGPGVGTGSVTLPKGLALGSYILRFYAKDGIGKEITRSGEFQVVGY
jgi:hypothetical protein